MTATFEELKNLPVAHAIEKGEYMGVPFLIMRGPASLCAYIAVFRGDKLWGMSYDDVELDVHGGLTFSGEGDGEYRPSGFYWFGWDYAHAGDKCFYDLEYGFRRGDKEWLVDEVRQEVFEAIHKFKKLEIRLETKPKAVSQ